jgi:hypothetical protein
MLTTRELALLIISAAFAVLALSSRDIRRSIVAVVKAFLAPKVVISTAAFGLYMGVVVWTASRVDLWNRGLLKDTIIWCGVAGFALLLKTNEVRDLGFFRQAAVQTLGLSAFVEIFLNTVSFHLVFELLLIAISTLVACLHVVATHQEEHETLKRPLEVVLSLIGLGLIIATVWKLSIEWSSVDHGQLWLSAVLALWLPLAALPYIYALSLVMGYELAFMRMNLDGKPLRLQLALRAAAIVGLGGRLRAVHGFAGTWPRRLGSETSFGSGLALVHEFRATEPTPAPSPHSCQPRPHGACGVTPDSRSIGCESPCSPRERAGRLTPCRRRGSGTLLSRWSGS